MESAAEAQEGSEVQGAEKGKGGSARNAAESTNEESSDDEERS